MVWQVPLQSRVGSSGNEKGEALGAQERLPRDGTDSTSQGTRRAGPGRERTEGRGEARADAGISRPGNLCTGARSGRWGLQQGNVEASSLAKLQGTSS